MKAFMKNIYKDGLRWTILMAGLFSVLACSNNPAPVSVLPANYYGGAGACGTAGGTPLRADGQAFGAYLNSNNTLSLNLFYATSSNIDISGQNIVGSGTFSFPDLMAILPQAQGTIPNYSFCVSSQSSGAASVNGIYDYSTRVISMTLNAAIQQTAYTQPTYPTAYPNGGYQSPYYSPYAMPTPTLTSLQIYLSTIQGCVTQLISGRIAGCVAATYTTADMYGQSQTQIMYFNAQ